MNYRGRFAPSPTGLLHAGSLAAALGSWLCARHAGGQWLVRMENIDPPREVPGSAAAILAALPMFGLVPDGGVVYQSSRLAAYDAAFEQLRRADLVFPCWCSRNDLATATGLHRDGRCIAQVDESRAPAWRVRVPDEEVAFVDGLQGPQGQHLREAVGDFVIRRVEGFYSYQLACVVDDAWQGVTEVVRGSDLLDSTPRQIWLQRCLGLPTPHYLHLPLVLDDHGRKLSKSERALEVDPAHPLPGLRRALAFLGAEADETATNVPDLLHAALTHFDPRKLTQCSGHRVA
ncbi:tRNA glutamyl-Q(34) synthetase GluQRS [Dyella psychrodurans]|uniref:Glutamyl-Q tRNA(Asp) synthetase n=1 Tax=Dyella psychrodurans TaxID=1927960 RepID=A0A370WWF6_9GAMM|nr:tRNA glutamyl-Q(34) synthetase GluQRS [Dyella psychrodurans]RDS80295.1 tRNA glutamyl-Q(34) synthetase GluQRS [Dyella psychrodurans]